jgi:hypothetical protein
MDMGAIGSVQGIRDTSLDDSLIHRLAANRARGWKAARIAEEAQLVGIPVNVLEGVYAIETSFRPIWVRVFEDAYLFMTIAGWLITGRRFRNISVGPFQIGLHWLAEYLGTDYTREGDAWRPRRSVHLVAALLRLPFFDANLKVAAYRVKVPWEQALSGGADYDSAVIQTGTGYNGRETYGVVLLKLTKYLARSTPMPGDRAPY